MVQSTWYTRRFEDAPIAATQFGLDDVVVADRRAAPPGPAMGQGERRGERPCGERRATAVVGVGGPRPGEERRVGGALDAYVEAVVPPHADHPRVEVGVEQVGQPLLDARRRM